MATIGTKIPQANRIAVAGLFKDESHSEKALDALQAAGFSGREVGVAAPEDGKSRRKESLYPLRNKKRKPTRLPKNADDWSSGCDCQF